MNDYDYAVAFVAALTGSDGATARMSFRCLHDTDKGQPGHSYDGSLAQLWSTFVGYQQQGWGIFVNVNELDGQGRELANVSSLRAHIVDLDGIDSRQQYEAAAAWSPAPSFAVESSPDRYHV